MTLCAGSAAWSFRFRSEFGETLLELLVSISQPLKNDLEGLLPLLRNGEEDALEGQ